MTSTQSPTQVDPSRHSIKVIWVNTMSDSAQMIKVKPIWDGTMLFDLESPVRQSSSVQRLAEFGVPIAIGCTRPEPATGIIDHVSGPVVKEGAFGGTRGPEASVVLAAHTGPEAPGVAFGIVDRADPFHGRTIHQVRR